MNDGMRYGYGTKKTFTIKTQKIKKKYELYHMTTDYARG